MRGFGRWRAPEVGLAVAGTEVVAVIHEEGSDESDHPVRRIACRWSGPGGAEAAGTASAPEESSAAPTLPDALDRLFGALPDGARLHVALLPDLVEVRRVEHPPMNERDVRAHLRRRAARYGMVPWAAPVVGLADVDAVEKGRWVAFAPADVVEAVYRSAGDRGHRVTALVPGVWCWAGAESEKGNADGRVRRWPTPAGDPALHLVVRDAGGALRYRRVPDSSVGREAIVEAGFEAVVVDREPGRPDGCARDPMVAAASGVAAAAPDAPNLVPERARAVRRIRKRNASYALTAAAVVCLVLAAAARIVGLDRELSTLEAERQRLAVPAAEALRASGRIGEVSEALEYLDSAAASRTRWSGILSEIAEHLPPSAHLTSFRGSADTLVVEGIASEATDAVEGMASIESVRGLRAVGPVRREMSDGDRPIERFHLSGIVESGRSSSIGTADDVGTASEPADSDDGGAP